MGRITQKEKKAWGVHSRFKVEKDADVLQSKWGRNLIYFILRKPYSVVKIKKEYAMNGSEIILLLFVVRLVVPFGVLMLVGEWIHRKESNYWLK
jgi:hypothetical protein